MKALLVLLLSLTAFDAAAETAFVRPIGTVLVDADENGIPESIGLTVTVSGRATTSVGLLGDPASDFYVQDASGGIQIRGVKRRDIGAGDSLVVTGTVGFDNGMAYIDAVSVARMGQAGGTPKPLRVASGKLERLEGQLVETDAIVVGRSRLEAGDALMLTMPDQSFAVAFAYAGRDEPISFEGLELGDRVRVTGIAGQFDRFPPFTDSYQVYPRSQSDIRRAGVPTIFYQSLVGAVVALCLFALVWVRVLRTQVQRRVAQLHGSENRYRILVERASDAVILSSIDGEEVELNRAARTALGLGPGEPVPTLETATLAFDHATAQAHFAEAKRVGSARSDIRLVDGSGAERTFDLESSILWIDGADRLLSIARDVGSRRAYEQGLVEAREQAEEMALLKSAFLASMSHEIRTPLTAVLGFAEVLREEVGPDQRDLVEAISSGGQRLLATLNSVLDLARLDAGSERLRSSSFDLVGQIRRSLDLLDSLASKKKLKLTFRSTSQVVPVMMDAGAVDRVLINLVGNAIKFTDHGGISVVLHHAAASVTLTVTDTGIGMDPSFIPDLFSEFRQESEGEARSHEGTGLGMAITKRLVDMMGGTIDVASAKGEGTTFTITLPRSVEAEATHDPAPQPGIVAVGG